MCVCLILTQPAEQHKQQIKAFPTAQPRLSSGARAVSLEIQLQLKPLLQHIRSSIYCFYFSLESITAELLSQHCQEQRGTNKGCWGARVCFCSVQLLLGCSQETQTTRLLSSLCSVTSWEKQPGEEGDARSQLTGKGKGSGISPPASWRAFLLQGNRLQHCGMKTQSLGSAAAEDKPALTLSKTTSNSHVYKPSS